jgi:hypothetical protein
MDWAARDLATAFINKRFTEHSEFMFKGPLDTKSEEVNYLMLWIGEKAEKFSRDVSDADKKKLQT